MIKLEFQLISGKNTMDHQEKTTPTYNQTKNILFLKISFYCLQTSLILHRMSLTAVSILLNCFIRYAHILILHEVQGLAAASTSKAAVLLSKIDFVLLNATRQTLESIHIQKFKQQQTKILLT